MWSLSADPRPRASLEPYQAVQWDISEEIPLAVPDDSALASFARTLEARRSERAFGPLTELQLTALLWHAARTKQTALSPLGVQVSHRLAPSGGGIHPIHLVIQWPGNGWVRYDPEAHALNVLGSASERLSPVLDHCAHALPVGNGRVMLYVAEFGKTAAKYENAQSVVWRDAGALQATVGLVAASLGLHHCLLGITGNPWASGLSIEGKLQGVGVSILGSRP
jgi:SagB-type dehydrogenase family enzyme